MIFHCNDDNHISLPSGLALVSRPPTLAKHAHLFIFSSEQASNAVPCPYTQATDLVTCFGWSAGKDRLREEGSTDNQGYAQHVLENAEMNGVNHYVYEASRGCCTQCCLWLLVADSIVCSSQLISRTASLPAYSVAIRKCK